VRLIGYLKINLLRCTATRMWSLPHLYFSESLKSGVITARYMWVDNVSATAKLQLLI